MARCVSVAVMATKFSISTRPGQGIAAPRHQYDVAVT
jgi:hypothetical protein